MTITINEIVFKENSGLSLDVGFTQLSFNSVINMLNQDFSFLIKGLR